jgi:hypothetical protein
MRRRELSDLPSPKTFSRFGNKQATIARLVDYCAANPELSDVRDICAPLVESQPEDDAATSAPEAFVYLMKSGKHYKIGGLNSVGRRSYEFGLQLPEAHTVVHCVRTDDPVGIERHWHERFADRRANGEWFALTTQDVKAFKRRRSFM